MTDTDADLINVLRAHGAARTAHLRTTLMVHLQGTHAWLRAWGADDAVCRAGLFHAVRGTQHFDGSLDFSDAELERLIGADALSIVRTYVDADRAVLWPQFGQPLLRYRCRHDGSERWLSAEETRAYCLLTLANELDILARSRRFRIAHGARFRRVLLSLAPPLIPERARADALRVLGAGPQLVERAFCCLLRVWAGLSRLRRRSQKR